MFFEYLCLIAKATAIAIFFTAFAGAFTITLLEAAFAITLALTGQTTTRAVNFVIFFASTLLIAACTISARLFAVVFVRNYSAFALMRDVFFFAFVRVFFVIVVFMFNFIAIFGMCIFVPSFFGERCIPIDIIGRAKMHRRLKISKANDAMFVDIRQTKRLDL